MEEEKEEEAGDPYPYCCQEKEGHLP